MLFSSWRQPSGSRQLTCLRSWSLIRLTLSQAGLGVLSSHRIKGDDVSNWTFPKVKNMSHMFNSATAFNGDVSTWTFPNVTTMSHIFTFASSFNGDVSNWTFPAVTDMSNMFDAARSFEGNGASNWTFPEVTNMNGMFQRGDHVHPLRVVVRRVPTRRPKANRMDRAHVARIQDRARAVVQIAQIRVQLAHASERLVLRDATRRVAVMMNTF